MKRLLIAGTVGFLLTAPADAFVVFSSDVAGLTSTTLAAGTYDFLAIGASGGGSNGGLGALVRTRVTFATTQTISILVGGLGATGDGGDGGGGASFLVGADNQPLLIAGGGAGGSSLAGGNALGFAGPAGPRWAAAEAVAAA